MLANRRGSLHPLVAAAAVAVILVCLIALANMTGVLTSTTGAIAAANAATGTQAAVKPSVAAPEKAGKHLPKLSATDSLGPGETLVIMDDKAPAVTLEKALPPNALPPNVASTVISPIASSRQKPNQGIRKTTIAGKSDASQEASARSSARNAAPTAGIVPALVPTPTPAPGPRIVPVYRDMRIIDNGSFEYSNEIRVRRDDEFGPKR